MAITDRENAIAQAQIQIRLAFRAGNAASVQSKKGYLYETPQAHEEAVSGLKADSLKHFTRAAQLCSDNGLNLQQVVQETIQTTQLGENAQTQQIQETLFQHLQQS